MDIRKLRVDALRRLIGTISLKEFAESHDLDSSYLSQILNGHRNLGEKAAQNMEAKIGCRPGALVAPAVPNTQEPPLKEPAASYQVEAQEKAELLSMIASDRSRAILERIAKAAADGHLTEDDLALLDQLAARISTKNTQRPAGPNKRIAGKIKDANNAPE